MSNFTVRASQILGEDRVRQLQAEGSIAAQIKAVRKRIGLSQEQLADLAGLPKSTIGRIEAGLNSPSVNTLTKIARALKADLVIQGSESSSLSHN
ncbi:DNA-binding transcriptional repressor PuuR [Bhargavaea cecembensis DSE10]|uniref:DNA-binding transcriptional repressor PuuR n=1 Tax=Bhargavaea cecembensis DSE10 TaxID=1235279 RepID=M7P8W0_9BACL|nr:helix-turn-helix transcriptional regulator [Bhargavaea cecembensis]EMR06944.1 DNA-binding transcriptional repressor PuuR [Bhargavaea cecembensis DSE10]